MMLEEKQKTDSLHITVLKNEAIDALQVVPGKWHIDATSGGGGHTQEILNRGGKVLGFDQDADAVERLNQRFAGNSSVRIVNRSFEHLKEVVELQDIEISGVLFDLGLSSDQLDKSHRGFSFLENSPLDMRMDKRNAVTAADLVNGLTERELTILLSTYGEVFMPKRIAQAIVKARDICPLLTTGDLAKVVEKAYGSRWSRNISPSTQVFQALRIAVNDELEVLKTGLSQAMDIASKGARIVVISFHSLEDRIVKHAFKAREDITVITTKVIVPSDEEISRNTRARSAKMRIAEKI